MPKLACHCGYVHNLTAIPDDGYLVVRDRDYEKLLEAERKREEHWHTSEGTPESEMVDEMGGFVYEALSSMYLCPECGRLMWEREKGKPFEVYLLEKS